VEIWLKSASAFLAVASFAPAVRLPAWWVRIFDFPRAQALFLGLTCLALDLLFLDLGEPVSMLLAAALGIGVTLELARVLPYTPVHRPDIIKAAAAIPENRISLLTCNVLQENRSPERLLERIAQENPDIVLLLEVDDWWMEALRDLEPRYPYRLSRPQDDTYGMALYSRLELIDPEVRFVRRETIPSIKATVRLRSGLTCRLFGLHPAPPAPQYAETTSQRDAELVLIGREAKLFGGPVIVAGDLNDVAWSHTTRLFRRISGLLDPRIGRQTMATFPVAAPLLRFPLDHVFVSNHFKLVDFRRLEDVGSDHFPVWAHFQLEANAEAEQPEPEPEGNDRQEAREIVAEANEELEDEAANQEPDTIPVPSLDPVRAPQAS
jgi:endonuclease/exonuclease/phosphatase (EEP) superfamily protein YafD